MRSVVLAAGLVLAGCSHMPLAENGHEIEEWEVVNAIKCELQLFLSKQKGSPNGRFYTLSGKYPGQAEITLKVATSNSVSTHIGAIVPYASGSIAPSFGFTSIDSKTITTTTVFLFDQVNGSVPAECPGANETKHLEQFRFSKWLSKKFAAEDMIIAGSPRVGLRQIILATDFGLRRVGEGNVTLSFMPVSAGVGVAASRDDIQSIKLTFRGHYPDNPPPELPRQGPSRIAAPGTVRAPTPGAAPGVKMVPSLIVE